MHSKFNKFIFIVPKWSFKKWSKSVQKFISEIKFFMGIFREKLLPDESLVSLPDLEALEFVGYLMAFAVKSEGATFPLNFPSLFWKQFVGDEIGNNKKISFQK